MKITELENAPQWLKNAIVENEDVEIINGIVFWKHGTWKYGIWEDGTWEHGTWKDGIWKDGIWKDGIWEKPRCKWDVSTNGTTITIGCKIKTIQEWDDWFASAEEFETKRDTEQFKLIHKAYLSIKASI